VRPIHSTETVPNASATRFYGVVMDPSARLLFSITAWPASLGALASTLNTRRVRISHMAGMIRTAAGTPSIIHWGKVMTVWNSRCMKPMAIRLVGVPTGVMIPPTEAA
jgi:hypothetical protein